MKKNRFKYRRQTVGKFEASDLILPAIVLGAAYYIFTNFLGDTGTTANNAVVDQNTAASAAAALAAAQAAGSQQTISDTTLNSLANSLYEEMIQDPVPQATVLNNLMQVNTQTDWQRLYQLFGTRQGNTAGWLSTCAFLGYQCNSLDLGAFVKLSLDDLHRSEVNSYFSMQGINANV